MRLNAQYWGLEMVLKLYKEDKINLIDGVKLIRAIIRGMGIKEAKEILENLK
jgi:ribosomal protein L7/L12